jgi:pantoate--beta-alanine ligase
VELIRTCVALRSATDAWRASDLDVGLVPTMGALHEGHDALIERARRERDRVVVSIFVNPLQFVRGEDFDRYPRDEATDLARAEGHGADVVWAPPVEEMYPPGAALPEPDPGEIGTVFEGAERPGHFAGVLKAVHRLLDVTGPCAAYFGEKDVQQLFLVRKMIHDLGLASEIIGCPTVREPDGLARSSRNAYLSAEERDQAGCLFLGLSEAAALARGGERDAPVVDETTFEPIEVVDRPARAIVAARFPSTRLIDNLLLPRSPA